MIRSISLHRFAICAASAILLLMFLGGQIRGRNAGLPVPEWPNTYGHFRIDLPGSDSVGDDAREHAYHLIAWLALPLTLGLGLRISRGESGLRLKRLALAASVLAIVQVIASGAAVGVPGWLAAFATPLAQAQFCSLAMIAFATFPGWNTLPVDSGEAGDRRLRMLTLWTMLAIALQLVLGGIMRGLEAGLAIPDVPTMFGGWIPPLSDVRLAAANRDLWENGLIWKNGITEVTRGMMIANLLHRLGALVVATMAVLTGLNIFRRQPEEEDLRRSARLLLSLIAAEIVLGALTILTRKQFVFASAHVVVGALALAASLALTVRAWRIRLH